MAHPERNPIFHRLALTSAIALSAGVAACSLSVKPTGAARPGISGASAAAFEPVELRIHPLTRLRELPAQPGKSVDLYFELLDRFGHGVKSLGTLTVELRAVGVGGQREPFQVRTWTVEMTDPASSSAAFDRVTRTYHVTLADVPTGEAGSSLRVRFRTGRGRDVTGVFSLAKPGPS
jgi:hypothetical protein